MAGSAKPYDLGEVPKEWQDWIVKQAGGKPGVYKMNPYNSGLYDLRNALGHFRGSTGLAVIALLLAGLAVGCWFVRRRLLRTSRGGSGAIVFLTLASLPAFVIVTFLVFRLLR